MDGTNQNQVWTPAPIVNKMMGYVAEEKWADPNATFLDPTMGAGNIVIEMIKNRIAHGVEPLQALKTVYGIEIDKVQLNVAKEKIRAMFPNQDIEEILKHNFVCSDLFKWDIKNWRKKKTPKELRWEKFVE